MEVDMDKRAYSDPEDPRNLFAAMYGGVYKREDPYDLRCGIYRVDQKKLGSQKVCILL